MTGSPIRTPQKPYNVDWCKEAMAEAARDVCHLSFIGMLSGDAYRDYPGEDNPVEYGGDEPMSQAFRHLAASTPIGFTKCRASQEMEIGPTCRP